MTHNVRWLHPALLCAALAGCASSDETDDRPSRSDCQAARASEARLAVALAAKPGDDAPTRAELARHEANLAAAGGDEALSRCVATDSKARLRCVAKASTQAEAASCR